MVLYVQFCNSRLKSMLRLYSTNVLHQLRANSNYSPLGKKWAEFTAQLLQMKRPYKIEI